MGEIEFIRSEEFEEAFRHSYRHYLTGHLQKEQPYLRHFEDDIEIGMSDYQVFTADVPHVHPVATEHGYVLKGKVRIRFFDSETGTVTDELEFSEGDYFLIRPGVMHASKNMAGTRILFIKAPGGNDKTPFEVDEETAEWLKNW